MMQQMKKKNRMETKQRERRNIKHNGLAIIICYKVEGEILLLRLVALAYTVGSANNFATHIMLIEG